MSLKAKLEAVIYAAEEPVTLTQLAGLFAGDALEWRAQQQSAAAEQAAEVAAGESSGESLPLIAEGLENIGFGRDEPEESDTEEPATGSEAATSIGAGADAGTDAAAEGAAVEGAAAVAEGLAADGVEPAAVVVDPEVEARREARQRERDVKGILKQILDELVAEYARDARGVEIREIAGGYRMATKPECHDAVRLFVKSLKPPLKLSLPALETLAVVAYKQPVTAPEVSEIRGVDTGGVLGSLLARKLIATAGRKQVIGRPILYKTTKEFLLRFGLKDVAELPSMEEFEKMAVADIEEMEPEAAAAEEAEGAEAMLALEAAEPGNEAAEPEGLDGNSPSGQEMADAEWANEKREASEPQAGDAMEEEAAATEEPEDAATAAVEEAFPADVEITKAEIEATRNGHEIEED